MTDIDTTGERTSRRTFLRRSFAATAGLAVGATGVGATQARVTRKMIIPAADTFAGNYEGQFVFIEETADASTEGVPVEECEFDTTWPADQTEVYQGQLIDRVGETPTAVDLQVYTDATKALIQPNSHFIVQNVVACRGDYVGLETEWVTRQAVSGEDEPPGPTVAPGSPASPASPATETDGPGFGAVAAILGGAGALAVRAIRHRRRD